jgi:LPXTG-motif cell wall-anchored protein
MKDDTTKVEFRKKASDTGKLLAGAKFVLYDSKGDKVTSWTSTNKAYRIDASLKVGAKYIWHEVSAPSGYKKAEDVTFMVNKDGKVQVVEMIDEKIVTPDLPKTGGTSSNPAPLIAIGITMMIAGAFVFFRVKTREN